MKEISVKVEHKISMRRVEEVILSLTTTYSPWIAEVSWEKNTKKKFHLIAKYNREKDTEWNFKGRKNITVNLIKRGLKAMIKEVPARFGNIMNDEYDALDADCFFQCVVFGKLIYE